MTESYWHLKWKSRRPRTRTGGLPHKCDIAVIGGGLTGIAAAYYLGKFGCRNAVVLEKDFIGSGASGRNAGFLLAGLSEAYSRLVVGMGADSAKELMTATIENHNLIKESIEENNIDCEYEKSGSFHLAVTDVEKKEYVETVALLNRDGFEAEFFDDLSDISENLDGFSGGYYYPGDGKLDPLAYLIGLSSDIDVIENFNVSKITKSDGALDITGEAGTIEAEMAILATNGYSPLLDKFFERLIFPVRGQMTAGKPISRIILGDEIYYAHFGYDYFRKSGDNNILIGGLRDRYFKEETGYIDEVNQALQSDLIKYMREKLGIADFQVEARWSGLMGDTIDGLPIVGALPHNGSVIAAAGFNGHGFGLGMIVARDLAKAVMTGGRSGILERFSLKRFI